jgi:ubiquinone/menaquinone biosynthesis C-methylase UbiE
MGMPELKNLYEKRYSEGYRDKIISYDFARKVALKHFILKILKVKNKKVILDYGCGSGLFIELWKNTFPTSDLYFCDISSKAIEKLRKKYPEFKEKCGEVKENKAPFQDSKFDIVVSIEVMEHVSDLNDYLDDIYRLLKKGGRFIWTTPCANPFSIEHLFYKISNQTEKTSEGFSRWKREDPTHIRRLKSHEIKSKLQDIGFEKVRFKFRAHFFSFICSTFFRGFLRKIGEKLMLLDYALFRSFPNGASMIGCAFKR